VDGAVAPDTLPAMGVLPRSAGVLLHPTSLPSGRLDDDAYRFIDWLALAGVGWWQMLPLSPADPLGSPYASPSAFAASPAILGRPDASVRLEAATAFRARESYWIEHWTRYEGEAALDDQVRFDREWAALRAYAHDRRIGLIGDVPLYVAADGADVRGWPAYFQTDVLAGAAPDARHPEGQLWGNRPYDWNAIAADGYRWWIERFRRTLRFYDLARLDHFRGFAAYWAIPVGEQDARKGHWRAGPGRAVFDAAAAELGPLPLFAEDLGSISEDVLALRDSLGFPGIGVLVRGFDGPADSPHRLANHHAHQVIYTSTHDTDTAAGWYAGLPPNARASIPVRPDEVHWGLIELALTSPATLAIVPVQDVLGLGTGARMNRPGTTGGTNWRWRLEPGQLTDAQATRLRDAVEASGRAAVRRCCRDL
jgi:4-alpha-glucanotransferase